MAKIEVKLERDVVQQAVDAHIKAAILGALRGDPQKLVENVVAQALSVKADNYGHQTLFQKSVEEMIREAAKEEFGVWIEQNKSLLRAALAKKLQAVGGTFLDTLADKLVNGLASNFYVSCQLKVED